MSICQLRINMNYDVYIPENDPVIVLSDVIDSIYQSDKFKISEEYHGDIPEDIMMKILIYGYMNDSYSTRKIELRCRRDINFMWLLNGFHAPDHSTISRFRKNMAEQIEKVFYALVSYLLILFSVYDKIQSAEIWIPYQEVKKYYLSRLIHFEKRIIRSLG